MKQKKIPERQCLGCGAHKPKQELLRVVRGPDGTVTLDFTGKKPGRGAYICPDPACFKKARRGGQPRSKAASYRDISICRNLGKTFKIT